jgi:iron complex outermembrane receptor protein
MKKTIVIALLGMASPMAMAADTYTSLPNVVVFGEVASEPNISEIQPAEVPRIANDGGDMLREALGVDAGRIGGHGFEPNIRGQQQNRINVLLDGAYIYGGCPNRMDPPSGYAALDSYERVTILKGVQTLLYGGGGSGGTVLFDRVNQAPEDGLDIGYGLGGTTNGVRLDTFADVMAGNDTGYVRLFGNAKEAENYSAGNGDEIRSSFEQTNGLIVAGLTPGSDKVIELSYEYNNIKDALFEGRSMDAPDSTADSLRFKYDQDSEIGFLTGLSFEAYSTQVDHLMDNYSLRDLPASAMPMRVPTTSDTAGGRLLMDTALSNWNLTFGIDLQNTDRDATRYSSPGMSNDVNNVNTSQSILWPGTQIDQTGLILEGEHPISGNRLVKAGIRYDYVTYDATRADEQPEWSTMMAQAQSPNQLYSTYYGTTASKGTEHNLGFLLRYEQDLAANTRIFTGISRSMRTADATERYMASWSPMASMTWVGNPELDPEAHHQIDFGVNWGLQKFDANAVVYADFISDYILAYRTVDIVGPLLYKNADARIYGAEVEGGYNLGKATRLSANAAYTYGQNTTDDRPLAQIAPLSGQVALDYTPGKWSMGTRIRAAASQTRIDENSGWDAGETAGWAVIDVYGNLSLNRYINLQAGVDNLGDKYYANHLNAIDAFTGNGVSIAEPGITGWLKLTGEF